MSLSPASMRFSGDIIHGSGGLYKDSECLCSARHSHAQLPKFKQTCSTVILTISTYHSSWVQSRCSFSLLRTSESFFLSCYRLPCLFILPDTGKGIWSPQDIVLRRTFAPPSPGIQWDYTVIISISILYDSLFHVRDLQSCFINSAWMKPHFKHRGA